MVRVGRLHFCVKNAAVRGALALHDPIVFLRRSHRHTADRGLLILLEVVVHEPQHERGLYTQVMCKPRFIHAIARDELIPTDELAARGGGARGNN